MANEAKKISLRRDSDASNNEIKKDVRKEGQLKNNQIIFHKNNSNIFQL